MVARQGKTAHELHVEKVERLLPWGLEQRVSLLLIVFKLPLIILVGFIGLCAELTVKAGTLETFSRSGSMLLGGLPACYTHKLSMSLTASLGDFGIIEAINATLLDGGVSSTELFRHNLTIDPLRGIAGDEDFCLVEMVRHGRDEFTCSITDDKKRVKHDVFGGIAHMIPFALLWFVCKVLYIGIHPVDRAAKVLLPAGDDPPEPLFKLLTEPYFQRCTFPMFVVMKIFHYIRYRLMPNALLGALVSMEAIQVCPDIIIYRMHWFWGTACYFLIVADVFCTLSLYGLVKTVFGGKLVGTNIYRLFKLMWFLQSFAVTICPFWALFYTFGGIKALLQAVSRFTRIVLTLDLRFAITVDVLRLFVVLVVILEAIELMFFIFSLMCPPLLGWLPCCACLKDIENAIDDDAPQQYEALPKTGARLSHNASGTQLLKSAATGLRASASGLPTGGARLSHNASGTQLLKSAASGLSTAMSGKLWASVPQMPGLARAPLTHAQSGPSGPKSSGR